ncbi:MAPK/MAK/MRK overlapping kinase isoform X3 [Scleropages formosus]|uniref:MAPK/MAK/MRK overlapping kinase isoform X3 n=1 Tax=Scleropages formosus TaxID=113540 RepID=UPI0008780756|nr:MAPK/MAK/MRK overlapping kinase isoform X3 [Scleropages formosus]
MARAPERGTDVHCEQLIMNKVFWEMYVQPWHGGVCDYRMIEKIGEGTFSQVLKAQSLRDGRFYACKIMKQPFDSVEQVNKLREVQAMKRLSPHPNIIQLHEIIFNKETGSLSLICELMDMNIYEFIQGRQYPLPDSKVKHYMYQLCKSLDHMHRNGIFHRDVKPENILIRQDVLKLADFGSCRSMYSQPPHTEYISTRWYRAPECLLTDGYYSHKMDVWSAGCVFFEIISLNPLFPGTNELDQVSKIHDVLGTPDSSILHKFKQSRAMHFNFPPQKGCGLSCLVPQCSAIALSLLYQMLKYDPEERIGAEDMLQHPYLRDLRLAEKRISSLCRVTGTAKGCEASGAASSMDHLWRIARQGRKQHHGKHAAEPLIRCKGPLYPAELPKLNIIIPATKMSSFPVTSLPPLPGTHRGSLPAFTSKICHSQLSKPRREMHRRDLKSYHIPPIEQKRGGY